MYKTAFALFALVAAASAGNLGLTSYAAPYAYGAGINGFNFGLGAVGRPTVTVEKLGVPANAAPYALGAGINGFNFGLGAKGISTLGHLGVSSYAAPYAYGAGINGFNYGLGAIGRPTVTVEKLGVPANVVPYAGINGFNLGLGAKSLATVGNLGLSSFATPYAFGAGINRFNFGLGAAGLGYSGINSFGLGYSAGIARPYGFGLDYKGLGLHNGLGLGFAGYNGGLVKPW